MALSDPKGFNKPRFVLRDGHLQPQARPNALYRAIRAHSNFFEFVERGFARLRPSDELWSLNTAIIEAIAAESNSQGVPVLFVRLPEKPPSPFERLDDYFRSSELDFIDLGSPDAGLPPDMHLVNDGHLAPNGHRFVKSALIGWMADHMPHLLADREAEDGLIR